MEHHPISRIAFYLSNVGLGTVDCSKPLEGNPGIGGSQFCFLLLIDSLVRFKPEYHLSVYVNERTKLPFSIEQIEVKDVCDALLHSASHKNDLFFMKQVADEHVFETIDSVDQKVVVWGHNYYHSELARWIARSRNVVLNVFVGRQLYDSYIDHDIIDKSTFVFNMVPCPNGASERKEFHNSVVFLGAIQKGRGFDVLAKQWKRIIRKIPDAQLYVIGTGRLYNRNSRLGKLGVADEAFEHRFAKYLADDEGQLLKSVHFLGLLGSEKYDIFRNSAVGVVNPSRTRETFGIGIVEMNSAGLPVVTKKKNGFLDTVRNNETGLLVSRARNLHRQIVRLLSDRELNQRMGAKAKACSRMFAPNRIIHDWLEVLDNIANSESFKYIKPSDYIWNNRKWLRIANRYLRKNCSFSFLPAIIDIETYLHRLAVKTRHVA